MKKHVFNLILVLLILSAYGCGKKGPLKIDPEIVPGAVRDLKIVQIGENLELTWKFPQLLNDRATEFDINNVKKVFVYYSEKQLTKDRFAKSGKLLGRYDLTELTPLKESYSCKIRSVSRKFSNKKLYTVVSYKYNRMTSDLSDINEINILPSVPAVSGLSILKENKVIKLKWSRQTLTGSSTDSPVINGYNVYRKIDPDDTQAEGTDYTKINKETVINEYYEDNDTGMSGNYSYYVSALTGPQNMSERSDTVNVKIKDVYPPEIPQNVIIFRSDKGLILTWKNVSDMDLSHYNVYRKKENENDHVLINAEVKNNRFTDTDVEKGKKYSYCITSIDNNGNESEDSEYITEVF